MEPCCRPPVLCEQEEAEADLRHQDGLGKRQELGHDPAGGAAAA